MEPASKLRVLRKPETVGEISLVITCAALLASAIGYLIHGDYGSASALLLALGASAGWSVFLATRRVPTPFIPTKKFRPLQDLDSDSAWPRPIDVKRICASISRKQFAVPVIVGASGVGKSTLINVLVRDEIERPTDTRVRPRRYHVVPVTHYVSLHSQLAALRDDAQTSGAGPIIIVLDQFEQWLAHVSALSPKSRHARQSELHADLKLAQGSALHTIVLGLRSEWYYHLRFLGTMVPAPHECCHVEGASVSRDVDTTDPAHAGRFRMGNSILTTFGEVLQDEQAAAEVVAELAKSGRVSPLEAQIVGATVERAEEGDGFDLDAFKRRGVEHAVSSFFRSILAGAEHESASNKILCALSTTTRFRRQMDRHRLERILFDDNTNVRKALEYLVKHRVVIKKENKLELAHDYLAEYFHRASASELTATERDNIFVHAQPGSAVAGVLRVRPRTKLRLGVVIPSALLVFMLARLLVGADWNVVGPDFSHPIAGDAVDLGYVPILLAQGAWLVYAAVFFDRFFDLLDERGPARWLSVFVILNLGVCVGIGATYSAGWIVAIAIGGAPVAIKLLLLSRRTDLNQTSRDHLAMYGIIPACLVAFFVLVGAGDLFFSLVVAREQAHDDAWLAVNAIVAAMVFAVCVAVAPVQASKRGVSQMKGLIERPSGAKVPVLEGEGDTIDGDVLD